MSPRCLVRIALLKEPACATGRESPNVGKIEILRDEEPAACLRFAPYNGIGITSISRTATLCGLRWKVAVPDVVRCARPRECGSTSERTTVLGLWRKKAWGKGRLLPDHGRQQRFLVS